MCLEVVAISTHNINLTHKFPSIAYVLFCLEVVSTHSWGPGRELNIVRSNTFSVTVIRIGSAFVPFNNVYMNGHVNVCTAWHTTYFRGFQTPFTVVVLLF